jgi:hypothetical protein
MVVETHKRNKRLRRLADNISANLIDVCLVRTFIELNCLIVWFSWEIFFKKLCHKNCGFTINMECLKLLSEYQLLKDVLAEVMFNEFCNRFIAGIPVSNLAEDVDVRLLV